MRRLLFFAACTAALAVVASPASAAPQRLAPSTSYVVLYDQGTSLASARLAVRAAGGVLVAENRRVGVATATSFSPRSPPTCSARAPLRASPGTSRWATTRLPRGHSARPSA